MEDEHIAILVPTFSRPHNVIRMSTSFLATVRQPEKISIVFGIHAEDTASIAAVKEMNHFSIAYELITRHVDNLVHLAHFWNQLYLKVPASILGFFGDDVIFRTKGWDCEVRKEFSKDKKILVFFNDVHIQKGRMATLFFTHRDVHENVGFYMFPNFRRIYMDAFWSDVFRNAGKQIYRPDLIAEHRHPQAFPAAYDHVFRDMEKFYQQDEAIWLSSEMRVLVNKVSDYLRQEA